MRVGMGNSVTAIPFSLASFQRRSLVVQLTFITATEKRTQRVACPWGQISPENIKASPWTVSATLHGIFWTGNFLALYF